MNIRDATNFIEKADTGCELTENEKIMVDLMVHNIKHEHSEEQNIENKRLHSVLLGNMYENSRALRKREILHDRPGYTGFCRRSERQKQEIMFRHKFHAQHRQVRKKRSPFKLRKQINREYEFTESKNILGKIIPRQGSDVDRMADNELDEESLTTSNSTILSINELLPDSSLDKLD